MEAKQVIFMRSKLLAAMSIILFATLPRVWFCTIPMPL